MARIAEQIVDVPTPQILEEIAEERISVRIAEQIVDVPTPQILEEIVEERISARIADQIVDVPTPQILEEIVEERISARIAERLVDVPTPQILEEIVEERIAERTAEQFADVPIPQIRKEIVEVGKAVKNFPQERISERIYEQADDVPVPQILSEIVEVKRIDADFVPFDQPGDGPTVAKSVDEAPELKACTAWIMQLVQRKTRAERQGKHKAVLKLGKEIATAMASKREVLRDRFEDRWRGVARQMLHTWHRNVQGGAEGTEERVSTLHA